MLCRSITGGVFIGIVCDANGIEASQLMPRFLSFSLSPSLALSAFHCLSSHYHPGEIIVFSAMVKINEGQDCHQTAIPTLPVSSCAIPTPDVENYSNNSEGGG